MSSKVGKNSLGIIAGPDWPFLRAKSAVLCIFFTLLRQVLTSMHFCTISQLETLQMLIEKDMHSVLVYQRQLFGKVYSHGFELCRYLFSFWSVYFVFSNLAIIWHSKSPSPTQVESISLGYWGAIFPTTTGQLNPIENLLTIITNK